MVLAGAWSLDGLGIHSRARWLVAASQKTRVSLQPAPGSMSAVTAEQNFRMIGAARA